ncbi:MAG TPA: hypothetical protein VFX45_05890 [Solirubrobacterales bacterium]|nr:hypothetical protein [Solirubrobacterales bacterium]
MVLCPAAASAALPDGRAYELVSPAQKLSVDVHQAPEENAFSPILSPDGETIAFTVLDGLDGGTSNGFINAFRATRGAQAWGIEQLNSPISSVVGVNAAFITAADSELKSFLQLGPPSEPLTDDAADGVANLYLRTDEGFRLITVGAPAFEPFFEARPLAHSADLGHVLFTTSQPLSPTDPFEALYDWSTETGQPVPVQELPDGSDSSEPVSLASPPETLPQPWNPVSSDGSHVFFVTGGQLYARIDGTETKQVSASQTEADPNGPQPAAFRFASTDGSRAFFSSAEKLTDDATAEPGNEDLYRYDVATETLTDVTVAAGGAGIQGVLGGSEDGKELYFAAGNDLGGDAEPGESNLYVWQDDGTAKGTITHITTGVDASNWSVFASPFFRLTSRVTPDGQSVLFESSSQLTAFPNEGHLEAYLFTIGGGLECASCNPANPPAPATADALAVGTGDTVALARTLSDDGKRVFFSTEEALVAEDTNDQLDAYMYNAETNTVALISPGTGPFRALFADASADGSDVAFTTRESLVGIDTDRAMDVYDARVGGGLPQGAPPVPVPCAGQECRGPIAGPPPPPPAAASTTATGAQAKPKKQRKHKKKPKHKKRSGKRNGQR